MKIGIIGCGIITQEAHVPALVELKDIIEVTALCNHSRPKAEQTAMLLGKPSLPIYADWKQMFLAETELEAVLVALPIPMNYPVSRECIEAGLSVLCEKPAGINSAEAVKTLELNKPGGPVFMTAENYHYSPSVRKTVKLIQEGLIGTVHSIQWNVMQFMRVDNKFNKTVWRSHNEYPGGYVMDGGVHFVHAVQQIAGPVTRVYGRTRQINPGLGSSDMGFALMTHESGTVTSLNMGWQHAGPEAPLLIYGTRGSLVLRSNAIFHVAANGAETEIPLEAADTFTEEWKDFHRVVTTGTPPRMAQEEAVRDVRVIEAIVQSQIEGGEVQIPV